MIAAYIFHRDDPEDLRKLISTHVKALGEMEKDPSKYPEVHAKYAIGSSFGRKMFIVLKDNGIEGAPSELEQVKNWALLYYPYMKIELTPIYEVDDIIAGVQERVLSP